MFRAAQLRILADREVCAVLAAIDRPQSLIAVRRAQSDELRFRSLEDGNQFLRMLLRQRHAVHDDVRLQGQQFLLERGELVRIAVHDVIGRVGIPQATVEQNHLMPRRRRFLRDLAADKTGSPDDHDFHGLFAFSCL